MCTSPLDKQGSKQEFAHHLSLMAGSLIKTSSELATLIVALKVFTCYYSTTPSKMLMAFGKMLNILYFTSGP